MLSKIVTKGRWLSRGPSRSATSMTVRDALNSAMDEEIGRDPKVFLMGGGCVNGRRGGCAVPWGLQSIEGSG